MSACHATLFRDSEGGYSLEDLGSKNGTTLNGDALSERESLFDGDVIGVGGTFLLFRSATEVVKAFESTEESLGLMFSLNPRTARRMERARRIAKTNHPMLITGHEGSGRRTAAEWLHRKAGLSGLFVEINASQFLENLLSFREAQGGTLVSVQPS